MPKDIASKAHTIRHAVFAVLLSGTILGLAACSGQASNITDSETGLSSLEIATPNQDELIFSSVKGTSSAPQNITLRNVGNAQLELYSVTVTGSAATAFELSVPALPLVIAPGESVEGSVVFTPQAAGVETAALQIESSAANNESLSIALYGLGSEGEQGSNEPALQQVVDTLGYSLDVGGSELELGASPAAIGDETLTPFFEKASDGPVTLEVVARYGPEEVFPYGFFTLDAAEPVRQEVGQIAAEDAQELLPPVASGSTTFDPGTVPFGIYGQASGTTQYSLDGLNTGTITHALRVYPLKDRGGNVIANSYLIGLEEAENGDYQDAVFVLSNVKPAATGAVDVHVPGD